VGVYHIQREKNLRSSSQQQQKIKQLLTVFEATAICTKFDVRLVSSVDPTIKASFNYGQISSLSMAEEKPSKLLVTDPEERAWETWEN
jgi:hypothetical protein